MRKTFSILCLVLLVTLSKAQPICTGELGFPILNFDFGQGNTSTFTYFSPLPTYAPGLSTNTIFQNSGTLPAANTSGLVNNSSVFGPSPQWVSSFDHTGNTNGLLFGLNMPDNIGDTVVEYVMNDLCPNTTLQFSIWLLNLMAPTHPLVVNGGFIEYPNMVMRIVDMSNNVLGTYTTGNVPTDGIWHQYSFLFSNGNNAAVKLQLINNTQGSEAGNDVALDDITVSPCVPVASISPKLDTTFCKTTSLTFTAGITPGVYTPPNYQWQYSTNQGATWINGGNATATNTFNFTFTTANAATEYWIRYLASPGNVSFGTTNCHAISDTSIIRIDTAKHNFLAPDDTLLCPNTHIFLPVNLTNASSYLWSTGATAQTLDVTASGTYWLQLESQYGCKGTDTISVTIPTVPLHVDFSYGIKKACTDDTVQFNNLSDTGKYSWSFGDMTLPEDTVTSPMHIYDAQGNYLVRLIMRNDMGCEDSTIKIINTSHPLHAAFSQSNDTICQNMRTPVQFTDASIGSIAGWQWQFGDGGSSNLQNPGHVYTTAGSHTIQLAIHDDIPCYDTVLRSIKVDSLPFLILSQDRHAICEGEKVTFTTNYLQTSTDFTWSFGDGTGWSQYGNTAHGYDNAGVYFITLVGDYGVCGIVTVTDSVIVNAFPKVNLGPDSVLCLDGAAIDVSDLYNNNDPSIQWLWNTGATTPSISIIHPGKYSVTATKDGCATTENIIVNKDCYIDIPNAFTPNGDGENDYFFPKALLSKGLVGFKMKIFDRWGVKIFESTAVDGRGWDGSFNGKDQPLGVYVYMINAILKNGRTESYTGNITLLR